MSSLLALLQLVSPALPVGAFSYSEGLEVLVQQGRLAAAVDVQAWLEAELQRGLVRVEAAALTPLKEDLQRWRDDPCGPAEERVRELDDWLLAQREALEMRQQQRQMGRSLMQLLTGLGWSLPGGAVDLSWPAAWSWAGLCLELHGESLCKGYLFSWAANQLSAAVRLVPLGPTEGQRLQLALAPLIDLQARQLQDQDPRQLTSAGVGAGLAQLQHAELYSRLFRS
ncbi:MAG: urease accessory protein UreF [Synechococcus sp. TMED19]|nr:MAG: urease accessory protein UreF [Synechococcus sp. TMED19]